MEHHDTIFAMASGPGRAAIAVLRLSGTASGDVLDRLCRIRPLPRRASWKVLRDRDGGAIDRAIVLWLPGPTTFTGEDCAELHVHGSRAVVQDLMAELVELGLRPAEPGEFTRRAFLNGRMDLVEAEGLADLVDAETTAQRRQALRQLEGGLGRVLEDWRATLSEILAQQEALIDFPDEDLPPDEEERLVERLRRLLEQMQDHLHDNRRGERLRDGLVFAIVGAPNAGKSTLLNALVDREVAIVSPIPGTTRDVLEARMVLGGVPVTFLDTAGIRATDDAVEAEGVRRAIASIDNADVMIVVQTPLEPAPSDLAPHPHMIRVITKIDLMGSWSHEPLEHAAAVSAITGDGMSDLVLSLSQIAQDLTHSQGSPPLTRARHRAALMEATEALDRARFAREPELRAEDVRLAIRAIGRITGRVGTEDILDLIFREFCIGK